MAILLLSVLSFMTCLVAGTANRGNYPNENGIRHLKRRALNTSTIHSPNVDFTGLSIFDNGTLSGLDLTDACETALYQAVYCDEGISSLVTNGYVGSFDNSTLTTLVCDASCGNSIAQLHSAVSTGCGETAGIVPGFPFLGLVDMLWSNWNQSCFNDATTGQNCNDIIAAFPNVTDLSELPTADLCSYCNVQKLAYMQGDAYTGVYDKNWESMYEYVAQTCGLLIDDFNATQSVFNVTVPSTPVNCVSGKMYTTNQGDTCDSIATKYGVSAATMFYTNPDIANCSSIIPGTNLCLPLSCTEIWSVQPNDTCTSIAIANSITPQNVLTYNSQLNSNCTNLHSTNPYWGSTLCVSTPGGTYTGQALNNTSTASQVVDPPLGATVAPGTTTDCGEWLVNEASPHLTCAQICLANGIAIKLFTQANPSLNKETCDSDLVVGNAYCVDPLTGWNWGINSTSTTTATSTTSSQTSVISNTATTTLASTTTTGDGISTPTPHQTGMASNCDRFYLVSSGDDCETIASNEGISLTDFYAWNPAVGTSCAYLDLNEYVCVLVIGATASATSTSTPTVPSNGIPTPTPYQTGMATNCDDFYLVVTNDECGTIATNHGITLSQFYQWNPAVGSSCQYLGLGDYPRRSRNSG
ncbi:hypothetical protein PENOC_105280 [Penicillium occitanis (nom. inval.)]|nr:hypothetical protein PENOC_105280 [Penicillium occitanis (nom. inval.)]